MILVLSLFACLLLGVLLYPLLTSTQEDSVAKELGDEQEQENFRLYQERVQDIQEADLEDAERAAMLLELDKELLNSTQEGAYNSSVGLLSGMGMKLLFAACVLAIVTFATLFFYQQWGAFNQVKATELLEFSSKGQLKPEEYQDLSQRLSQAVLNEPKNLEWAYLKGRLLQAEGKYQQAADVYSDLLGKLKEEQLEDRATVLALVAEMRFFANGQQADEALYQITQESLALIPEQRQALGLAGIMAYELGYFEQAIGHWRVLWQNLAPGMESKAIENAIFRASQGLQAQGKEVDISWLGNRVGIQVSIDIADEVKQGVPANAILFVLARSPDGPPLPLAVERLFVSQLPVTIFLDDSMAMAEGMNLSSVESVTLTARISLSGQPMAQPGDWQVQVEDVATRNAAPQRLLIREQIPD